MGIDPAQIKNPKFKEALERAQAAGAVGSSRKAYTLSEGLMSPSTLKSVVVPGLPVGKPRMTQRDKWQKRDCVLRYRAYCDLIRDHWQRAHGATIKKPDGIMVIASIPVSASWSKKKKEEHIDCGHQLKPDGDNILKGCCDALFDEDSCLWVKWVAKFWCAEGEEATDISVLWYE